MKNNQFLKFAKSQMVLVCFVLIASLFLLGGCGGGGSDSTPTPVSTTNAIEAWSGNWSGSGTLSGSVKQEGGDPMVIEIPLNLTSVLVEKGSGVNGEAMTVLLNGTASTQLVFSGKTYDVVITLKNTKGILFGEENENGDLSVTKGSLDISNETVTITLNGDSDVASIENPVTYELPLTDPLLLTSSGFSYTFEGTKDDVSGGGKLEGTLSGNNATITGSGSGSGDVSDVSGSITDLNLTIKLTKK